MMIIDYGVDKICICCDVMMSFEIGKYYRLDNFRGKTPFLKSFPSISQVINTSKFTNYEKYHSP